ncbi:MAG TPA: DNA translocase FtsK 4TM domain-containing protein, partial [bacterium]|nr:DNA translocase FtsK 4TM domain-containing protein [bacterium]
MKTRREIASILLLLLGVLLGLSLIRQGAGVGKFGELSFDSLFSFLGYVAYALPLLLIVYSVKILFSGVEARWKREMTGLLFMMTALALLFQLFNPEDPGSAGILGNFLRYVFVYLLGKIGAGLLGFALFFVGVTLTFEISLLKLKDRALLLFSGRRPLSGEQIMAKKNRREDKLRDKELKKLEKEKEKKRKREEKELLKAQKRLEKAARQSAHKDTQITKSPDKEKEKGESPDKKNVKISPEYNLPSVDFLSKPSSSSHPVLIDEGKKVLESTFQSFSLSARIVDINVGPAVICYEVELSPGVKISQFAALERDFSLALGTQRVRLIAPIPGKARVGIEVPRHTGEMVVLREIIESEEFRKTRCRLPLALGKKVTGEIVLADLAGMPHLLIAGATGSGKSVCIHSLICSLLYRLNPDEVKLLLIDPKVVELPVYNGI